MNDSLVADLIQSQLEAKGYWQSVESYLIERTDAQSSHGCSPECRKKLYPDSIPRT